MPAEEDDPTDETGQEPVDNLKSTAVGHPTQKQTGPNMAIKDKIKMIDDHARVDREEEALEAAIASSSETAFPSDTMKTSDPVAGASTKEAAEFVGGSEADEGAKANISEEGVDTGTSGDNDVPMDDLVAPTAP